MSSVRTDEMDAKYQKLIDEGGLNNGCALCSKPAIKEFQFWKIVENDFPYDKIASTHHMIVPKRHATEKELSQEEWWEFAKIKESDLHPAYDYMMEGTHRKKSIPGHFHWHLIVTKD